MGYVHSVNVAFTRTGSWTGSLGRTGIDKRPAPGPVRFGESGVTGDSVFDTKRHGAWYQAAYAFDTEDLRYWSDQLGKEITAGNAGENLSLVECDCNSAVIGERWRVGEAVLRVTGPRVPCRVFAGFWDVGDLIKRFIAAGRPGSYLAVEQPGEIAAGAVREVLSRPEHGVTVADVFSFRLRGRRDLAEHLRQGLDDLPEKWRREIVAVL